MVIGLVYNGKCFHSFPPLSSTAASPLSRLSYYAIFVLILCWCVHYWPDPLHPDTHRLHDRRDIWNTPLLSFARYFQKEYKTVKERLANSDSIAHSYSLNTVTIAIFTLSSAVLVQTSRTCVASSIDRDGQALLSLGQVMTLFDSIGRGRLFIIHSA